jgi:hypothetical protein
MRQGGAAESRKDEQAGSQNCCQHVAIAVLHCCFLRLRTGVVVGGLVSWFSMRPVVKVACQTRG